MIVLNKDADTGDTLANNENNDISVIDTDSFVEVERFDAGTHPDGIAYCP